MKIPKRFEDILKNDERLHSCILQIISDFQPILRDNKLYFFEEYTDHGIEHIESVLNASAEIITEEAYSILSAKDITVLIMAIILHDLGMHIEYPTFLAFLNGEYDDVRIESLDKKTWKQLWEEFLGEAKRFSSKQRYLYFGNENQPFKEPDLTNKDNLDGADKKLIGEFVRRFHTRFAHEVALKGLIGKNGELIEFGGSRLNALYKKLGGIVARSHGMNIRSSFSYLVEISGDAWKLPNGVNITFLMVVLRIADYFQFHKDRVDPMLLKLKTFNSPVSKIEHDKHLAIEFVQTHFDDVERLYVYAQPNSSNLFVKLNDLLKDIQHELDMSWAVLGEIYSRSAYNKQPKIKYRRITSNLEEELFINKLPFVADKISFQTDVDLPKLLIAPLYGNNPTFGARELIQNSVDACLERNVEEEKFGAHYAPEVNLEINKLNYNSYEFVIKDNGKGMSLYEIKNYFLRVGSSFRKSLHWKKKYTDEKGSSLINRNGRFGIGILAAFLLGNTIEVKTKHFKEKVGYSFKTTIDTEQIEIEINKNEKESGTVIKIKIDESTFNLLNREITTSRYTIPQWTGWYLLDFPKITYWCLDRYLSNYLFDSRYKVIDPDVWHIICPQNFKVVIWSYVDNLSNKSYWRKENLICNGILVPGNDSQLVCDSDVIKDMPTLVITDNEGNLPLTLNRNELDGELPFIEDLVTDLSKDFIARTLYLSVSATNYNRETIKYLPNWVDFAFLREGFTLQIDYFFEILKKQNYNPIDFISTRKSLTYNFNLLDAKSVLIPNLDKNKMSIFKAIYKWGPTNKSRLVISRKSYDLMLKSTDKDSEDIQKALNESYKIEFSDDFTIILSSNLNNETDLVDNNNFFNNYSGKESAIVERSFDSLKVSKSGDILYYLLKKYFGENVVIPYDIKEREKLYPLAFEELNQYMKKYQNKSNDNQSELEIKQLFND